jgi:hypothetical protein
MRTKYAKFKFSIVAIILLMLTTSITTATKPLPPDYGTADYSGKIIQQAEEKGLQIKRVETNTNHRVSGAELSKAEKLFLQNNIDIGTLAIVSVSTDRFGKTHIRCDQFYKGIPIFGGDVIYHFEQSGKAMDRSAIDGTQDIYISGNLIEDITASEEPKLTMYEAEERVQTKMNSKSFTAELGFRDLNAGISYKEPNFSLIWKIMPADAEKYPYAYIDANSGNILYYDDGIRSIKSLDDKEPVPDEKAPAPKEGIKKVVSVEYGPDKKKEVIIEKSFDKTIIKITKGATSEDCFEYLKECKLGDSQLCIKYETNCKQTSQCDEYLGDCKLGNEEVCEKWNSNCKKNDQCDEYLRECKLSDKEACEKHDNNCKGVIANTKEAIEIKENKIYLNEKELKIMPDTASEKAISTLQLKKEIEIELKDTGKPTYEIIGKKEVKILGLFKKEMPIKTQIDAETGSIGKTEKPWWSFLAKE